MVLTFTGTGNSRYVARRIADALGEPLLSINDRLRAGDTAPVETGERLILVTPTYAWRIPRVVRDWLCRTAFPGAERAWFVMTCGSEIGNADHYSRRLCREKGLAPMGTAQIVHAGELVLAMFGVPGGRRRPGRSWPGRSRTSGGPSMRSGQGRLCRPPGTISTAAS